MVPIHASFGLVNFMLAIATCITGLIEKEKELSAEKSIRRYEDDSENAWNCGSWFEYLLIVSYQQFCLSEFWSKTI
uniref:Cytochrome b561 domain-containing protein n=1 Tax=Megaselia scalaris TaxID=36166 RepID=T1H071_MEGSC